MKRQKKIKSLQIKEKEEVKMSETQQLESIKTEIDLARIELEKTKSEIINKKAELEASSRRDIEPKEKEIIEKQISSNVDRQALKEKIEKQRDYDNQMVEGRFRNLRIQGQTVRLTYDKHVGDVPKWIDFQDGKIYTIKRGFADQINGGNELNPCYYTPKFIQKKGEMDPNRPASVIHEIDSSNKKYAFIPINF